MFKRILGILCIMMCVSGLIATFVPNASDEPPMVTLSITVLFAFATYLIFSSEKRKEKRKARKESLKTCAMKHINGLPIAENIYCSIKLEDDKFIFSSGSMHFELQKSKIKDICIRTDIEIQQYYVSSAGGAAAGAMLFGPVGAIIGGRTKMKSIKHKTYYLIITYQSDEIKYIGFEIGFHMASANIFINDFKNSHTVESTYQL